MTAARSFDPDDLVVNAVIVHDVPLKNDAPKPLLTDAPVVLDTDLREYFQGKIAASLKARGLEIEPDPEPDASRLVRDAGLDLVRDPRTLISQSQLIATGLHEAQSNSNSPGLLCVMAVTVGGTPAVALLKLEREQGIRAQLNTTGSTTTIDLTYLKDLTLTDKTKVFKTALIGFKDSASADSMYGLASDDQRGSSNSAEVARFFLRRFLGAKLRADPDKTTLAYLEAVEEFIDQVPSPARQGRYHIALLASMQHSARDLDPKAYASELDPADKPAFRRALNAKELNPDQSFAKGLRLVEQRIKGFRLTFASGMTLVGREDDLETHVDLPAAEGEQQTVIRDAVKRLRGR